jgi:acetyl esterase
VASDAPHGYFQLPTHPAHDIGLDAAVAFLRGLGLVREGSA